VEQLAEALGPDSVLLVRAHYFNVPPPTAGTVATGPAPAPDGAIVDVSAYPVVEDLYLAADVMVTDYSSTMFDFAVLDKPIVVFVPDWQVYQELRGTYFDLTAEPPGAVAVDFRSLREIFDTGAYAGPQATSARTAFREKFCSLDDGGAAERVVRKVFLKPGLTA
jgi:CDP-glycerol glycerophosphotransferase